MARPDLSYLKTLILVVVGIPCGVLSGVTGQSASPILLPVVRWLLGMKGTMLAGVVLGAVAFCAWTGLLAYAQTSHVGWAMGVTFALGSFGGAAWAGQIAKAQPGLTPAARPVGAFIAVGLALFLAAQAYHAVPYRTLTPLPGLWLPPLGGLLLGIVIGFFGQAADLGSVLTAPGIYLVLGQTIRLAQGTALLVTVLAALFGSRLAIGNTLPDTALLLLQSLILGAIGLSLLFRNATPPGETPDQSPP
jgi:uncharacterized membrane protein YfcA